MNGPPFFDKINHLTRNHTGNLEGILRKMRKEGVMWGIAEISRECTAYHDRLYDLIKEDIEEGQSYGKRKVH